MRYFRYSIFLPVLFLLVQISCKDKGDTKRIDEVEFNIDSTLFDYTLIDSFKNVIIPRLKTWVVTTDDINSPNIFSIDSPNKELKIRIGTETLTAANSYKKYKEFYKDSLNAKSLLDLSNYLKDGQKLTQIILKDSVWTNFRILRDSEKHISYLDIFIKNNAYKEENIKVVESIIGSIKYY